MHSTAAACVVSSPPPLRPSVWRSHVAAADFEMSFKIKTTTPLVKAFDAFCERRGVPRSMYTFMFDGGSSIWDPTRTPYSLDMMDGDVIYALSAQVGC